jgi:hypothetical protein
MSSLLFVSRRDFLVGSGLALPALAVAELNFADDPLIGASPREQSEKAGRFAWVLAPRRTTHGQEVELNLRLKATADAFEANIRHGRRACGLE